MEDINRIIIPVDRSEISKDAVKKGFFLAKAINVEARIITVNDTHQFMSSVVIEERLKKEAMSYLDEFKEMGDEYGVKLDTELLTGNPADEIVNYAKKGDLIIMAHHERGKGIDKVMEKSVSKKVVEESPCSVLVVKKS
ncbi:MAG: universal stress protein [Candidatus Thermoplasmatota archaeon]